RNFESTWKRLLQPGQMAAMCTSRFRRHDDYSSIRVIMADGYAKPQAVRSAAQTDFAHKLVRGLVGFAHPVDDFVGLRRIFQLDADGAVDAKALDFAKVWLKVDHAAARRQVPVYLAVAVAEMDVDRLPLQTPQLFRHGMR